MLRHIILLVGICSILAIPPVLAKEDEIAKQYGTLLQNHLSNFNRYPQEAQEQGLEGTVIIHIKLNREGEVMFKEVARSSGSQVLDNGALTMLEAASPFPAMPDDYIKDVEEGEFMVPIVFMK